MENENHGNHKQARLRFWLPVGAFALAIGFLLLFEHRAHIPAGYIPIALFLVFCIGMHFFMHGSHSGHGGHGKDAGRDTPPDSGDEGDGK